MLRNGRAVANNGSDGEIKEALANAAFSQPQLQMVAYGLNALDVQMAGGVRGIFAPKLFLLFRPDAARSHPRLGPRYQLFNG